jgi:hypothetical protein
MRPRFGRLKPRRIAQDVVGTEPERADKADSSTIRSGTGPNVNGRALRHGLHVYDALTFAQSVRSMWLRRPTSARADKG